jgi:serine phosphatase RsbU (regulator of sigma subunit)
VFRGDEEFGSERLMDEFSKYPGESADGILDKLWNAIEDFAEGGPQGDDMTALAVCRSAEAMEMPA